MKENTEHIDTEALYEGFYKEIAKQMGDFEDEYKTAKSLALRFYYVLNSTSEKEKYSHLRSDRRVKNIINILHKMMDERTPEVSYNSVRNLVYDFVGKGRTEAMGVSAFREFAKKVEDKIVDLMPEELKELPIFYKKLIENVESLSTNPTYYDWTEELAKDDIDNLLNLSGMKKYLND